MPFVKKEIEEYYYVRTGNTNSPNTLVFVHGATMTGAGLAPFADQFKDFNCIIVDLPGHGNSIGSSKNSVEAFTDGVEHLIQELKHDGEITSHITVVGFSMGGCIAVELALRKMEGLKRIVVLSSGADLSDNTPFVRTMGELDEKEYNPRNVFEHLFGKYSTPQEKEFAIHFLMETRSDDMVGKEDLRVASYYDKQAEASSIDIPTFIVAGDEDELVPVRISTRLKEAIPNSSLLVLPYRGHSAIYEEMGLVVNTLNNFFRLNP